MTAESKAAVLTARRAAQHIRLFEPNDAYECLCILTVLPEPSPVSALCWQIHRRLAVLVPLLRVWVHCPRASNGLLPRRSNLVGYVQWGARFDRFLLCQTIMSSSFSGRSLTRFSMSLFVEDVVFSVHCLSAATHEIVAPEDRLEELLRVGWKPNSKGILKHW